MLLRSCLPLGYCSVTTYGTSSILHVCNNLFEVSTIWGKYWIVGRNLSCISHRRRTDVFRANRAIRWAIFHENLERKKSNVIHTRHHLSWVLIWLVVKTFIILDYRPLSIHRSIEMMLFLISVKNIFRIFFLRKIIQSHPLSWKYGYYTD